MNRWNIPKWLEDEVRARDTACVYCGVIFGTSERFGDRPSWEHIINSAKIITRENIVLCCRACNSSKGSKPIQDWLETDYCKTRNICPDTVADVVKSFLMRPRISGAPLVFDLEPFFDEISKLPKSSLKKIAELVSGGSLSLYRDLMLRERVPTIGADGVQVIRLRLRPGAVDNVLAAAGRAL